MKEFKRSSRVVTVASLTVALTAPVWWLISWRIALGWPGMEPFPTARSYITSWLVTSLMLCAPPAVIACCLALFISHHTRWRASAAVQALNWLWVLAPMHILWCVALLVRFSFAPGFEPFLYTRRFPATWEIPASILSSPSTFVFLWFVAAAFVLFRVIHVYSTAQEPPDPSAACERCGYSRAGLASSKCPECGSRLLTYMNRTKSRLDNTQTK